MSDNYLDFLDEELETDPGAYVPTEWTDEIIDPITGELIQKGTVVNARRLNNMEKGIKDTHDNARIAIRRTEFLVIDQLDLRMMYEFDHQARKLGVTANMYWNTYQDSNDLKIESGKYDPATKRVILP